MGSAALYTQRKRGGERFCKLCKKRGAEEGGGRSLQKGVSASAAATNPTVRPSVLKRVRSPLSIDSFLCANRSEKGGRSSVQKPALLFSSPPPRSCAWARDRDDFSQGELSSLQKFFMPTILELIGEKIEDLYLGRILMSPNLDICKCPTLPLG